MQMVLLTKAILIEKQAAGQGNLIPGNLTPDGAQGIGDFFSYPQRRSAWIRGIADRTADHQIV
jgi:hypothetical protein